MSDLNEPRDTVIAATDETATYLEDLEARIGQTVDGTKTIDVRADQVIEFARRFDPQPFHMDPEAGKASLFGGHAASGFHTAAMTMRLILEEGPHFPGGQIGAEIQSIKWPRPAFAGDRLRIRNTVVSVRPSRSNPGRGIAVVRVETLNQKDEVAQDMTASLWVPRRP